MRLWIGLAVLLAATVACAPHGPVIDTGQKPAGVGGTISGLVRTAGNASALSGRKVTAINTETGARYETSTASNGGYTVKVPTGTYRLELELRAGEVLAEQPAETTINASDMDADRNFTVTVK